MADLLDLFQLLGVDLLSTRASHRPEGGFIAYFVFFIYFSMDFVLKYLFLPQSVALLKVLQFSGSLVSRHARILVGCSTFVVFLDSLILLRPSLLLINELLPQLTAILDGKLPHLSLIQFGVKFLSN